MSNLKKNIACVAAAVFIASGAFSKQTSERPEIRETYIAQNTPYNSFITYKELEEDIETLSYYLRTAYAGYDDMTQKGFNAAEFVRSVLKNYRGQEKIESRQIVFDLHEELAPYISDSHFFAAAWNTNVRFTYHRTFYYANIFVEKSEDGFTVCQSGVPSVAADMKFTGSAENLFYYPVKGENVYRLGVVSERVLSFYTFGFDGKNIAVPVYDDNAIESSGNIKYREVETADSVYVSISSFMLPPAGSQYSRGAEIVLEKYANTMINHPDKKNIILDLRGNSGGITICSEYLFYTMTQKSPKPYERGGMEAAADLASKLFSVMWIESPATYRADALFSELFGFKNPDARKVYRRLLKNPGRSCYSYESSPENIRCFYDGRIIILVDRHSASASEEAVFLAKKTAGKDNVFVVGENSAGCLEYVNVINYALPNSGIYVNLGSKKITSLNEELGWHGEGSGIYPDFWSLGKDLNDMIFMITHDEELKEKLPQAARGFYSD